jgi:hypothetical protein
MGACEVGNGIYYVFEDKDSAMDFLCDVNTIVYEKILKRLNDEDLKELFEEIYSVFSDKLYWLDPNEDRIKEGYYTGLSYVEEEDIITIVYFYDTFIRTVKDYVAEEPDMPETVATKIIDAVDKTLSSDIDDREIDELAKSNPGYLGKVSASCHFGFGGVRIIDDNGVSNYLS